MPVHFIRVTRPQRKPNDQPFQQAPRSQVHHRKDFERKVMGQRTKLLNKYDMARRAGDSDLMMEALEEIGEFNEKRKDPKAKITPDTLRRSVKAREAAEKDMVNGIRFNKNLRSEIDDLLEEYEE